jgi:hypothetical protein
MLGFAFGLRPLGAVPHRRYRIGRIDFAVENDRVEAMKPTSESNPFVLPPALLAEVEAAADAEHRPVADVLRDVVERGLAERRQPLTDAYRQDLREKIAQGLQSLREGKGTDGEAFMARLDAELAEFERQGR